MKQLSAALYDVEVCLPLHIVTSATSCCLLVPDVSLLSVTGRALRTDPFSLLVVTRLPRRYIPLPESRATVTCRYWPYLSLQPVAGESCSPLFLRPLIVPITMPLIATDRYLPLSSSRSLPSSTRGVGNAAIPAPIIWARRATRRSQTTYLA